MIFARDSLVETPVNMKWFNCAISNFKGGKIPRNPENPELRGFHRNEIRGFHRNEIRGFPIKGKLSGLCYHDNYFGLVWLLVVDLHVIMNFHI